MVRLELYVVGVVDRFFRCGVCKCGEYRCLECVAISARCVTGCVSVSV